MPATGDNQYTLEVIHPSPEEAHKMPYAPAVSIVGACNLMFVSGCTPSKLYHHHPHLPEEHIHPHSIEEQTAAAMDCIKLILDEVGASFRDIVKITKYLTDIRDCDGMAAAMKPYMGDWRPASTMVCINQLSSPGARVELDVVVAIPPNAKKKA
ncbi:MAG TPA: Rid family hydrolase [Pseudolabrys sp.]|nr:Rid family hydrolase [Pseudolabrys sp.]